MAYSLELEAYEPSSPEVKAAWGVIGWNARLAAKGRTSREALEAAEVWLQRFDYDIVRAEAAIGKGSSRSRAKQVTFCKVYGGGPGAAAPLLKVSVAEAERFFAQFDEAMPEMNYYAQSVIREVRRTGCVHTLFGRRVNVDRDHAYKGVNYIIQGTAADLMKRAMVRSHAFLREHDLDAWVLMTVHDELIFEFLNEHSYAWVLRHLKFIMEDVEGAFNIPMVAEFKRATRSWNEKVKLPL